MKLTYGHKVKYDNLVEEFADASAASNCGDVKYTQFSNRFSEKNSNYILDAYLHLVKWTSRLGPIDLLVQVQETIEPTRLELTKSTVRVDHYKPVGAAEASLMQSVHFDFDGEKDQHPLFHAQFRDEPIELKHEIANEIEFNYTVSVAASCFGYARIPTSDMTVASVLLCLAADHLSPDAFSTFRGRVLTIQKELRRPLVGSLASSINSDSTHIGSTHWYAHMKG